MVQATPANTAQVSVNAPIGVLRGQLQTPASPAPPKPVLPIIPGSGPTDHDGNDPPGVKAAPYRLLAEGLAAQGIASVRIDKRGMFSSRIEGYDANKVTIKDYAADVHAWVAQLRQRSSSQCIWVLGHIEGALVAAVAARAAEGICGVVLVAGPGRNLADVMQEQVQANPANAPPLADASQAIAALRAGRPIDVTSFPTPLQGPFNPVIQPFLIDLFSYDPQTVLSAVTIPTLVVQGDADLQTSMADARRLASARPGITLKVIHGMNHGWKMPAAGRSANLASYSDSSLPLDSELVTVVSDFIKSHPAHAVGASSK